MVKRHNGSKLLLISKLCDRTLLVQELKRIPASIFEVSRNVSNITELLRSLGPSEVVI